MNKVSAVIASIALLICATGSANAAQAPPQQVTGEGQIQIVDEKKIGVADVSINDVMQKTRLSVASEAPFVDENGHKVMHVTQTIQFENGDILNAYGPLFLTPSDTDGMEMLNANLKVDGGAGAYVGAKGKLFVSGTMESSSGATMWHLAGELE